MLKEIFEQPHAVASALAPYIELNLHQIQLNKDNLGISPQQLSRYERIFMVACGTSYYASLIGEYVLERLVGIPVECDLASEFRYRHPVVPKDSLFIAISQSGETADTLAAVRLAKEQGAHVLSICNVPNSSIDREANGHIYMNAGVEIGVASTKAFTATLSLLNVLAIGMAKLKSRLNAAEERQLVEELQAVPAQMETVLAYDKFFKTGAEHLKNYKGFLFMGRGVSYPIALEGALKVKELAYMHAEGYAAGEMKHGPLALIDERMAVVMLVPSDDLFEKTLSNLQEAKARGGKILALGTGQNALLREVSEYYLALPKSSWLIQPLLEVIPLQLMAYHVADSLGHDVDQPRNLAKSVTVE